MYRTIPNSHFWTSLEGIYRSVESDLLWHATKDKREEENNKAEYTVKDCYEPLTPEYIVIGLKNCQKEGFKLKPTLKPTFKEDIKVVKNVDMFISIEQMIDYLSHKDFIMSVFYTLIKRTLDIGVDLKCERKMERTKVYKRIDKERDYQDQRWVVSKDSDKTPDNEKPVAEWLNYIEFHLAKAKEKVYMLEKDAALAEIRKVAALAVRCIEIHGCPKRIIPEELIKEWI